MRNGSIACGVAEADVSYGRLNLAAGFKNVRVSGHHNFTFLTSESAAGKLLTTNSSL